MPDIQIHGFVSEGGFWSTDNDYIGRSSQGSLKLFEFAVNVSTEVADRLRIGFQLYGREMGDLRDLPPLLDWAYLDYRWKPWLGLRAGIIKMPYGLYGEFVDIDSARVAILMPQSVYSLRSRNLVLAHTGFALYGRQELGRAGSVEYQTWLGTLNIPVDALLVEGSGIEIERADTRYVTGAQLFWHAPIEGLRIGATYIRAAFDFAFQLDPALVAQLVALGQVPADFNGRLLAEQDPTSLVIGSIEYTRGDWLFAAEYSRLLSRVSSSPPLIPTTKDDNEQFYVLATRRLSKCWEVGGYYSVIHLDPGDRRGDDNFRLRELGFQRDLALTVRWDINPHWYWKVEGHFIDGAADLQVPETVNPERWWGLFLFRTTVTF